MQRFVHNQCVFLVLFQMVVPKRTVALLDRLMRALSDTLEDVEQGMDQPSHSNSVYEIEHLPNKRARGPVENTSHNSEYNGMYDIQCKCTLCREMMQKKKKTKINQRETLSAVAKCKGGYVTPPIMAR